MPGLLDYPVDQYGRRIRSANLAADLDAATPKYAAQLQQSQQYPPGVATRPPATGPQDAIDQNDQMSALAGKPTWTPDQQTKMSQGWNAMGNLLVSPQRGATPAELGQTASPATAPGQGEPSMREMMNMMQSIGNRTAPDITGGFGSDALLAFSANSPSLGGAINPNMLRAQVALDSAQTGANAQAMQSVPHLMAAKGALLGGQAALAQSGGQDGKDAEREYGNALAYYEHQVGLEKAAPLALAYVKARFPNNQRATATIDKAYGDPAAPGATPRATPSPSNPLGSDVLFPETLGPIQAGLPGSLSSPEDATALAKHLGVFAPAMEGRSQAPNQILELLRTKYGVTDDQLNEYLSGQIGRRMLSSQTPEMEGYSVKGNVSPAGYSINTPVGSHSFKPRFLNRMLESGTTSVPDENDLIYDKSAQEKMRSQEINPLIKLMAGFQKKR